MVGGNGSDKSWVVMVGSSNDDDNSNGNLNGWLKYGL